MDPGMVGVFSSASSMSPSDQRIMVEMAVNVNKFANSMNQAFGVMKNFADRTHRGPLHSLQSGFKSLFGTIGRIAAAGGVIGLTRAFINTTNAAIGFDKKMGEISTLLRGDWRNAIKGISHEVQRTSVITGLSAEDMADAYYSIISAGVKAADAIDVLNVSAKTAVAGLTSTASAATTIVSVLNAYNMEASQAGHVSNILFETVRLAQTKFEGIAGGIGRVMTMAQMAGVELEELTASFTMLTRGGLLNEAAWTTLARLIAGVVNPSREASAAAEKYGVSLGSLAIEAKGLIGVLEQVKDLTAEQIFEIFPNIRGTRGIASISQKANEARMIEKMMYSSSGATERAYAIMGEQTATRLDRARERAAVGWRNVGYALVDAREQWAHHVESISLAATYLFRGKEEAQILANHIGTSKEMELWNTHPDLWSIRQKHDMAKFIQQAEDQRREETYKAYGIRKIPAWLKYSTILPNTLSPFYSSKEEIDRADRFNSMLAQQDYIHGLRKKYGMPSWAGSKFSGYYAEGQKRWDEMIRNRELKTEELNNVERNKFQANYAMGQLGLDEFIGKIDYLTNRTTDKVAARKYEFNRSMDKLEEEWEKLLASIPERVQQGLQYKIQEGRDRINEYRMFGLKQIENEPTGWRIASLRERGYIGADRHFGFNVGGQRDERIIDYLIRIAENTRGKPGGYSTPLE